VLIFASAAVFGVTGVAYLVAPAAALGIVGADATPVATFLLRTEGVALLFGAAMLSLVRPGDTAPGPLAALAGYFLLSSLVDVAAFAQGIVGPASIPSAGVRIAVGVA
jgi:hypothetical protein